MSSPRSTILDIEFDVVEDVDAYLDRFTFFCQLEMTDKAYELANSVLRRHLNYFPAFAELACYYIRRDDLNSAQDLLFQLLAERIQFEDLEEKEVMRTLSLFARVKLFDSTLATLEHILNVAETEVVDELDANLFRSSQDQSMSPIQTHNIKMRLWNISNNAKSWRRDKAHRQVVKQYVATYLLNLSKQHLYHEACELIDIMYSDCLIWTVAVQDCVEAIQEALDYPFGTTFMTGDNTWPYRNKKRTHFARHTDRTTRVLKVGDFQNEQEARISLLRLGRAKLYSSYDNYDDSYGAKRWIGHLITAIRTIFDHIPDSEPEGELLQQLQTLENQPESYTTSQFKALFAFGNPRPSLGPSKQVNTHEFAELPFQDMVSSLEKDIALHNSVTEPASGVHDSQDRTEGSQYPRTFQQLRRKIKEITDRHRLESLVVEQRQRMEIDRVYHRYVIMNGYKPQYLDPFSDLLLLRQTSTTKTATDRMPKQRSVWDSDAF